MYMLEIIRDNYLVDQNVSPGCYKNILGGSQVTIASPGILAEIIRLCYSRLGQPLR